MDIADGTARFRLQVMAMMQQPESRLDGEEADDDGSEYGVPLDEELSGCLSAEQV